MIGGNETEMNDELGKSRREINDLIYESQILRTIKGQEALIKYNQLLFKINEKQINFCCRLSLIGSDSCIQELDEISYTLEQYMNKPLDQSPLDYYLVIKKQLKNKLTKLTGCKWRD